MDYSNENSMDIDLNPYAPEGDSVSRELVTRVVDSSNPELTSARVEMLTVHTTNRDTDAISTRSGNTSPEIFSDDQHFQDVSKGDSQATEENSQSTLSTQPEEDYDDDEGTICPICLDSWTNTGEHRICALNCGHLFGYKCVLRWLESQQRKTCPTCKKPVKRSDLRYIYAKKLVAVDTTELENMREQLEQAKAEKNRLFQDVARYNIREHLLNTEIAQLRMQIKELSGGKPVDIRLSQPSYSYIVRLYMDKSMDVCKQNGSRVFDANASLDLIAVSLKSPASLWSGFGIRKISIEHYKQLVFIPLHDLQIRDISFHPTNNWVLTASMDKNTKVVDLANNTVLHSATQNAPLWSCSWDTNNENVFYIGTQAGAVVKYDIRNINVPVCSLEVDGDKSPVVSVACIPSGPNSDLVNGGVISCKLNSLWIFEKQGASHIRHSLPLEGPFVSMKYQRDTRQMLVSSRPNNRINYARHTLCTLEKVCDPSSINCHIVQQFQGGGMQKLLSKSCFIADKQDYVAAHHESNKSVYLWSINTGERVCSVPAHDAVLDLKGVKSRSGNFLVSLTEKRLEFFKFNTS